MKSDNPSPRPGDTYEPSFKGVARVDPSVRLGPLEGEPAGCVPLERTMAKPQAFKTNRYSKDMG